MMFKTIACDYVSKRFPVYWRHVTPSVCVSAQYCKVCYAATKKRRSFGHTVLLPNARFPFIVHRLKIASKYGTAMITTMKDYLIYSYLLLFIYLLLLLLLFIYLLF